MGEDAERILHLLKICKTAMLFRKTVKLQILKKNQRKANIETRWEKNGKHRALNIYVSVYQYTKPMCFKERWIYFKRIPPNKRDHPTGILQQSRYGSTVCC